MSSLCPFEAITWGAKMLSEFQNSPSEKAKNGAKRLIFAQKLGGCLSRKGPNLPFCLLETAKIASPPSILPSHFCTICPSEIFTLFHFSPFFLSAFPVLSSPSSAALAKSRPAAARCLMPPLPFCPCSHGKAPPPLPLVAEISLHNHDFCEKTTDFQPLRTKEALQIQGKNIHLPILR